MCDAPSFLFAGKQMLRSFFFAIGIFVGLCGMSLFFVDGVVTRVGKGAEGSRVMRAVATPTTDGRFFIEPPDWIGYTFVGMGGITMLYTIALPKH